MSQSVKERAYDILNIKNPDDPLTDLANYFLVILIILSIVVFLLISYGST